MYFQLWCFIYPKYQSHDMALTYTQIILAVYYTLADIVLLCQCFYYRGFTWKDEISPPKLSTPNNNIGDANESTGLLASGANLDRERRPSIWSEVSVNHLSPVVPLLDAPKASDPPAIADQKPTTRLQATFLNLFVILMVCAAGILGWWVSNRSQGGQRHSDPSTHPKQPSSKDDVLQLSLWGQIFGYFCAVLYLGSRVPQILLNYRRKSTEGVSMLFFLFACIGNLTYVLSIFAFEPHCFGHLGTCRKREAAQIYGRYILVNASWIVGSMGTLLLDLGIFGQFFWYSETDDFGDEDAVEESAVNGNGNGISERDQRPLLDRGDLEYR